jgi:hypothetical protein
MATIKLTLPLAEAPSPGVLHQTRHGPGIVHTVEEVAGGLAEVTVEIPSERAAEHRRGGGPAAG